MKRKSIKNIKRFIADVTYGYYYVERSAPYNLFRVYTDDDDYVGYFQPHWGSPDAIFMAYENPDDPDDYYRGVIAVKSLGKKLARDFDGQQWRDAAKISTLMNEEACGIKFRRPRRGIYVNSFAYDIVSPW